MEKVRKDKRFDYNDCYAGIKYLLKKHPEFSVDGDVYAEFANNLKKGGEFSKASEFYKIAINDGYAGLDGLKGAYSASMETNDTEFLELALSKLDSLLALKEHDDKGVEYWLIGNELTEYKFPERAITYYTKAIVAGYSDYGDINKMLVNALEFNNTELRNIIADSLRHRIALGYTNIEIISSMMDCAILLKDRDLESNIIDRLEKVLSNMKLAEQCKHASMMELRYGKWGYGGYAEKWLQKIIKCDKKHL